MALLAGWLLPVCLSAAGAAPPQEPAPHELLQPLRQAGSRRLAAELAHRGLPADAPWAELLAGLDAHPDPLVPALVCAAAVAPQRLRGRAPLEGAALSRAVDRMLEAVLRHPEEPELDLLFERLRPHLGARELQRVAAFLRGDAAGNRRRALSLVLAARHGVAADLCVELALDPALEDESRAYLVDRVLLAEGRAGLAALDALTGPDAPSYLLRRALIAWQPLIVPADLARFEAIARGGPPLAAQYALQLWARHEQDPERKLAIFEMALGAEPGFRAVALDALARGGLDAGVARRLVALLDSPNNDLRQLAMRMLPRFAVPEDVHREFRARMRPGDPPRRRAAWMMQLVRLPIAEAQRTAAEWLADEGWSAGSAAGLVARSLHDSPAVDPLLPRLLRQDELPAAVLVPLAIGRAAQSDAAREWLRRSLEGASGLRFEQIVSGLARGGRAQDLELLAALAADPALPPMDRAAAVRALAVPAAAAARLQGLLDPPPEEYEVAEALVQALVGSDAPVLRATGLRAAREGLGFADPDESRGLRVVARQAQVARPRAEEAGALAQRVQELLEQARRQSASEPVTVPSSPRELAGRHPELHHTLVALTAALGAGGRAAREPAAAVLLGPPPRAAAPGAPAKDALASDAPLPADVALLAVFLLAEGLPEVATVWAEELASRPGLAAPVRVQALANWARAELERGGGGAAGPLRALLSRPADLVGHPWDLASGLDLPEARGWVLPVDRVSEQAVYAEVLAAEPERLARARTLLEGYASPSVLTALAGELGNGSAAEQELGLRLALRAVDWAPAEARPRLVLGRLLAGAGEEDAAAKALRAAVWLSPPGGRLQQEARQALAALPAGGAGSGG